jgi:ribokinase
MEAANILFFSDDNLKEEVENFVLGVENRFRNDIIIVGRGDQGAYMYVKEEKRGVFVPAVATRPVINTIGAGDALFSSFIHFYNKTKNPHSSLSKAVVYASYKIGENGAAKGFLKESELAKLLQTVK